LDNLKSKLIYIGLGIVAGVFFFWGATMLFQRNQARSERDLARGQADSYAFEIAQRDAEIAELRAAVHYKPDTIPIAIPVYGPIPRPDSVWKDSMVVVNTTQFDTTTQFNLGHDTLGVRVKGKIYSDSSLERFNSLKTLLAYWYHHEPKPDQPALPLIAKGNEYAIGIGPYRHIDGSLYPMIHLRRNSISLYGHYWSKHNWSAGLNYDFLNLRF
jgi:hypothetical protein